MAQLAMFAVDLGIVVGALLALALCGWWVVAPFAKVMRFAWGAAALAGLVVLPLATLSLAVVLTLPLATAGAVSAVVLAGASLVTLLVGDRPPPGELAFLSVLGAGAAAIAVATCASADIALGGPAISYYDGSDHLGYAHAADWLLTRLIQPPLDANPTDAYASYVDYLFKADPRFGSFAVLGLVARVSGRPATFAYDLACALVLAASALGLAACFARSRALALAVAVAVLVGPLFDQGRAGFFGKLAGLPASVFALALYLQLLALRDRAAGSFVAALASTAAVSAGAAILFNGVVTAALLALGGLIALAASAAAGPAADTGARRDGLFALGILVALAGLSSGIVARPLFMGAGAAAVPWSYALARALGTDGQASPLSVFRGSWPRFAAGVVAAAVLAALALAVRSRMAAAISCLAVPVAATAALLAMDAQWHFLQVSIAWTVFVMGGVALIADHPPPAPGGRGHRRIALVLAGIVLALQLPHYAAAVMRFARDSPEGLRFAQAEIDGLARTIGPGAAEVRLRGPAANAAIVVLVEMGRRGVTLQWSPETWRLVLGYRPWPAPRPTAAAGYLLTDRDEANTGSPGLAFRTAQFDLLRR